MPRKAWDTKGTTTERGYGWQWQKLRKQIMARDLYLCQPCKRAGAITKAAEVDHIIAKELGGSDDPGNLEATCKPCHWAKTGIEKGYRPKRTISADGWPTEGLERFGFSIPHGLKPSGIPVTLLCGPPASGKSTYIRANAKPGDTVIDFDNYLKENGAQKWTADKDAVSKAFLMRDAHLRSLSAKTEGQAWVIAMAPTRAERDAWCRALGRATVVLLDVPADVCISRLAQDDDRAHAVQKMKDTIREWWTAYRSG